MLPLDEKPDNTLYSTRDELLINSNFPPLEQYGDDKDGLKKAYLHWLENESLGKNVCYIDLTFEVPSKGSTTLSIVPEGKGNLEVYNKILSNFIRSTHTFYPHSVFKNGIKGFSKDGIRKIKVPGFSGENLQTSESFFMHETDEEFMQLNEIDERKDLKFIADTIDLDDIYVKAKDEGLYSLDKINEIDITDHWTEWVKLHEINTKLLRSNIDGVLKWILVLPLGIVTENGDYKNIGSIFLGMDNRCKKMDVIYFTRSLVLLLISSSQRYYEKTALNSAIKSAIAAVMSRNMSHNLGSHVFYYTRQELLDIYEKEKEKDINWTYLQDIKGLAWFLHYVQERQDFIANINSNDKYPFGPLNLKQDVIDEMTPDAVDVRHNSEPKTKNFLLENIVRSENIKRRQVGDPESSLKNIDINIFLKKIKKSDNKEKIALYEFSTWVASGVTNFYEIDFAVNCGQQSRHAFLILLENIIRNSAKHGFDPSDKKDLLINIDIESREELYQITIYDNAGNAHSQKDVLTQSGIRRISNIEILKQSLCSIHMLDSDSKSINRDNKGLKEMLISILWMKGLELDQIELHAKDETILSIVDVQGNIGYRFTLPKFKNLVELNEKEIIALLQNSSIVQFGSIYSVHDKKIYKALENEDIFKRYKSYENIRDELSKIIPRILFNDDGINNSWEQLYKSRNKELKKHIISFDRDESSTIESLSDIVKLTKFDVSNAKIRFINHLSKSEEYLKKYITQIDSSIINHYRKPDTILESISGANQVFNLFQKFQVRKTSGEVGILERRLHDLYWNILDAYNTIIFIVDERLSYTFDDKCFDYYIDELLEGKIMVETFIDNCMVQEQEDYTIFLNEILSLDESVDVKGRKIVELLDSAFKEECTSNLFLHLNKFDAELKYLITINQNLKEKFLQQQNTYLFNLNRDNYLINSIGKYDSNSITEIDFFSIHIGLLDKMSGTDMMVKIHLILAKNNIKPKFISVHSGRGGLNSKEEKITFLPFSVLQRCLEDSKFVLSEFFNNYKYLPFN
jgi:hypothetical protein